MYECSKEFTAIKYADDCAGDEMLVEVGSMWNVHVAEDEQKTENNMVRLGNLGGTHWIEITEDILHECFYDKDLELYEIRMQKAYEAEMNEIVLLVQEKLRRGEDLTQEEALILAFCSDMEVEVSVDDEVIFKRQKENK